tara:strand:- start:8583 stop:9614 length:1032 start_codon:yes stop_codon:yes gene_type:complete
MRPYKGSRFGLYKDLLASSNYFKFVCGAGYEDKKDVEYFSYIYTLSGCSGFDLCANEQVVIAAKNGIQAAICKSKELNITIPFEPFITVSVGMPGDHHVRKATITEQCVSCRSCIPVCPTDAITSNVQIISDRCIGCGNCEAACPTGIQGINYIHNSSELLEILPKCIQAGADSIELHAGVPDNESTLKEWQTVSNILPNGMISMSLDRMHLSDESLISRIEKASAIAGERLIIQADGIPMSGGKNDFNTTLQAVSVANVISRKLKLADKKYKELPILISGGTNSYTGQLARQCGVDFNGIAIGTHARNLISQYRRSASRLNEENVNKAMNEAKKLISLNLSS